MLPCRARVVAGARIVGFAGGKDPGPSPAGGGGGGGGVCGGEGFGGGGGAASRLCMSNTECLMCASRYTGLAGNRMLDGLIFVTTSLCLISIITSVGINLLGWTRFASLQGPLAMVVVAALREPFGMAR